MDDLSKFGITAGLGGIGSALGGLFGGGGDPYDAASKYYNQIPGMLQGQLNPWIQQGQRMGNQLEGQYGQLIGGLPGLQQQYGQMAGMGQQVMNQYGQLMNDPNSVMNKIGSQYQQSPGFQFQMNQGMNAANNAAASGGMAGSPQHQQQAATMAEGLANQDYWNYMNKGLGLYGQGLQGGANIFGTGLAGQQGLYNQGLAGMQGMYGTGFQGANALAGGLANTMMNQGNLAFSGQAAQNQNQGQMWGNLIGGIGALAAFSSKALKEKVGTPSTEQILSNVREMALDKWKYKGINQEFIGPYAEEFTQRFGVGDGKTINMVDAIGVLMGAVKELDKKIARLESRGN